MYNIQRLHSELKQSEHEAAQMLYDRLIAEGYNPQKAVSLVYRAGIVDGRRLERDRTTKREFHKRLHSEPLAEQSNSEEDSGNV